MIVYGSRFGSTGEISQEIGKVLNGEGLEVQIVDLKKTKKREWPSLQPFDGVLVGSSIKMFKWMNEPKEFLKIHRDEIQKREKILGMFVSCGSASVPQTYEKAKSDYLEKIMTQMGIEADIYDAFGGVFDFSEDSKMGSLDKGILKTAAKQMAKSYGLKIDENGKNDFRNWTQIHDFARKFATLLKR